jgi:glycosyltransferase involved in cell wall biosynthesis
MRVLFYVGDNRWSGGARAMLAAARGLAARGHPVTVACCDGSRLEQDARAAEIETVTINAAGSAVSGAFDLRRVLAERFIEAAIVLSERDHLIVASAMRFAERGAVLRRIASSTRLETQTGGRLALRLAAGGLVVASERELREALIPGWSIPATVAPLGIDPGTYDGVDPATWNEMGVSPQALLVACSYDPSGRYRMGVVFRTLALLAPRHPNLHVVVFGPGAADDDLRMHAAALGVTPIVTFLRDSGDERRIMRAASAGWVVSGSDNGAYACLDFMGLRVPVIAERSPLTQHYVADGITGILLAPGDPSYTASHVAPFLSGEDKRLAMGNAARARAQREFSETAMIDGFERAVTAAGDRTKWIAK